MTYDIAQGSCTYVSHTLSLTVVGAMAALLVLAALFQNWVNALHSAAQDAVLICMSIRLTLLPVLAFWRDRLADNRDLKDRTEK